MTELSEAEGLEEAVKNATRHAETLRSLLKSLLRDHGKPAPVEKIDPLKALVRGAMAFDVADGKADDAVRVIEKQFCNLNELRVATELEVRDMLGQRYPSIEQRVQIITRALNTVFEREHTLSLDRLKTLSKRDARQFLRELPDMIPFVEAYVMLFAFDGAAAVPVDAETLAYLKEEGVLEEKATVEEAQKFLEGNLKGEECFEFYANVRKVLFGDRKKKKA